MAERATTNGIVIIEIMVVIDTRAAERVVSPSKFSQNIVVVAATGADAAIVHAIAMSPFTPNISIIAIIISGDTMSLRITETYDAKPFKPSEACAR